MQTITIDGLKKFTVDGKTYDFIPLDEWDLNDCCLFTEASGLEFDAVLGEGILRPHILRAALYAVARHHGIDLTVEDAGKVKLMQFVDSVGGEVAVPGEEEGNGSGPPAEAPARRRPPRTSSRGSKS